MNEGIDIRVAARFFTNSHKVQCGKGLGVKKRERAWVPGGGQAGVGFPLQVGPPAVFLYSGH